MAELEAEIAGYQARWQRLLNEGENGNPGFRALSDLYGVQYQAVREAFKQLEQNKTALAKAKAIKDYAEAVYLAPLSPEELEESLIASGIPEGNGDDDEEGREQLKETIGKATPKGV